MTGSGGRCSLVPGSAFDRTNGPGVAVRELESMHMSYVSKCKADMRTPVGIAYKSET